MPQERGSRKFPLSWSALNGSAGNAYVRTTFDKFAKNRADAWSHRFRDHSSMLIQINTAALALGRAARNLDPVVFGKLPDQRPSASASWFTFRNLR